MSNFSLSEDKKAQKMTGLSEEQYSRCCFVELPEHLKIEPHGGGDIPTIIFSQQCLGNWWADEIILIINMDCMHWYSIG